MKMKELIEQLLSENREGQWWDFKQQHHSNLIDLLHDILCMANVLCDGDRYLIFGVNDNCEIIGLEGTEYRPTQADIISYLQKKSFAKNNIPTIELRTIKVNALELDILVIKNERFKPYFLTNDETKKGKSVRAGTVYSRIEDTNTPKDKSANPYEIDAMWREQFGLDKKASERFVDLLLDYENWKYDGINGAFYDIDPDYTIEIGDGESSGGKFWWQEILFEKPSRYYYHLKYKKVELHKIPVIRFNSENLCIPFPSIEFLTYPEKDDGCITNCYCDLFYYTKGTVEYSLFKHIRALEIETPSERSFSTPIESQIKPPIIHLPFLILDSEQSLIHVCKKLKNEFDLFIKENDEMIADTTTKDIKINRHTSERLFSEWAYWVYYGKRI
jgi:hypothetical protein